MEFALDPMRDIKSLIPFNGELSRQFLAFLCIGAGITTLHYGVLITSVSLLGTNPVLTSSASYGLASLLNYYLNAKVTFQYHQAHGVALSKFVIVAAVGFLLNAIVMQACIVHLSLHYVVAQMAATVAVLLWNFYANLSWTFR